MPSSSTLKNRIHATRFDKTGMRDLWAEYQGAKEGIDRGDRRKIEREFGHKVYQSWGRPAILTEVLAAPTPSEDSVEVPDPVPSPTIYQYAGSISFNAGTEGVNAGVEHS